jgi:hypothetical protein
MTPGGPASQNASSVPSKKLKASVVVGNIVHQDQREEKNSAKKAKKVNSEE